jgi:hypothetical protein
MIGSWYEYIIAHLESVPKAAEALWKEICRLMRTGTSALPGFEAVPDVGGTVTLRPLPAETEPALEIAYVNSLPASRRQKRLRGPDGKG